MKHQRSADQVDRAYIWFSLLAWRYPRRARQLWQHTGDIPALHQAAQSYNSWVSLHPRMAQHMPERPEEAQVDQQIQWCLDNGVQVLLANDPSYPEPFCCMPDPPALLYTMGDLRLLRQRSVAIVGTRKPSHYGRTMASNIATGLVAQGYTIASGHATGIDTVAHMAALEAGGHTIAFLGAPFPDVQQRQADLYHAVSTQGLMLCEWPAGVPVQRWMFPARNRLVAGFARSVVIVEGTLNSGTRITADFALEFGKEVFAVPGDATRPQAELPLALLQDGANLMSCAEDILAAPQRGLPPRKAPARPTSATAQASLPLAQDPPAKPAPTDPVQRTIWDSLQRGPLDADGICDRTALPMHQLIPLLLELELGGYVRQQSGHVYSLC